MTTDLMAALPPYPDLSEPRLVATRATAAHYAAIRAGELNDGKFPAAFEWAVTLRWVPHSEEGFFQFLAWTGAGAQKLFEAGLGELYGFQLAVAGHTAEVVRQSIEAQQGAAWGSKVVEEAVWAGYAKGGGLAPVGTPPVKKARRKRKKATKKGPKT